MNQDQSQNQNGLNETSVETNLNATTNPNPVSNVDTSSTIDNLEVTKPTLDSILNGDANSNSGTVLESTTIEPVESLEVDTPVDVVEPAVNKPPVVEEVLNVEDTANNASPVMEETPLPMVEEIPNSAPEVLTEEIPNSVPEQPTAAPKIETIDVAPTENTINQNANSTETESANAEEVKVEEVPINNEAAPIDDFNAVPVPPSIEGEGNNKKQKTSSKKVLIILLLIILVILVGFGVYTFLTTAKSTATNSIATKEVKLELGSTLSNDITTYATITGYSKENCTIDLNNVDTTKVSTYKYTVTCGKASEEGLVIVDDTTKPEVVTTDLTLLPNATVKPEDFIEQCIDASKCSYEFESIVNTATIGEQDISIIVSDEYNNKNNVTVKLTIANSAPARYLTCTKEQTNVSEINAVLKDSYKIGIDKDDNFYNAIRTSEFAFNTTDDYEKVVNSYDENVGIQDIIGTATFNTSSNKIILKASKTMDDLKKELNGNIPNNSNILRAFLSGLGYICN